MASAGGGASLSIGIESGGGGAKPAGDSVARRNSGWLWRREEEAERFFNGVAAWHFSMASSMAFAQFGSLAYYEGYSVQTSDVVKNLWR